LVIPGPDRTITPNASSISLHGTHDDDNTLPILITHDTSVDDDSSQPYAPAHGSTSSTIAVSDKNGAGEEQEVDYIRQQAQPAGNIARPPAEWSSDVLQSFKIFGVDTSQIENARYCNTPKIQKIPTDYKIPALAFNWSRSSEDLKAGYIAYILKALHIFIIPPTERTLPSICSIMKF